jgi:hypothetical protein
MGDARIVPLDDLGAVAPVAAFIVRIGAQHQA